MPADVRHRLHLPGGVAGQEDGRAAEVDRAVAARARERAGEAEDERPAVEEDLELVVVAFARGVGGGGDLDDVLGEIGGAVFDVIEQPPDEAVLQCFAIHRDSSE